MTFQYNHDRMYHMTLYEISPHYDMYSHHIHRLVLITQHHSYTQNLQLGQTSETHQAVAIGNTIHNRHRSCDITNLHL